MRTRRPSRIAIFVRAVAFAWGALWIFFHALPFEGYYYVKIWSTWWFPLLLAVFLVLRIGVVSYLIDMLTFGLIMGNDPEYQQARRAGWHPFWSGVPGPFNPDYEPLPPTSPTGFYCPQCGTPHPSSFGVCLACGYGSTPDLKS